MYAFFLHHRQCIDIQSQYCASVYVCLIVFCFILIFYCCRMWSWKVRKRRRRRIKKLNLFLLLATSQFPIIFIQVNFFHHRYIKYHSLFSLFFDDVIDARYIQYRYLFRWKQTNLIFTHLRVLFLLFTQTNARTCLNSFTRVLSTSAQPFLNDNENIWEKFHFKSSSIDVWSYRFIVIYWAVSIYILHSIVQCFRCFRIIHDRSVTLFVAVCTE